MTPITVISQSVLIGIPRPTTVPKAMQTAQTENHTSTSIIVPEAVQAKIHAALPEEVTETPEGVEGILVEEIIKSSRAPQVRLDLVGSDAMVTINDTLLNTKDTTESTLQNFSAYLS